MEKKKNKKNKKTKKKKNEIENEPEQKKQVMIKFNEPKMYELSW